MIHNKLLVPSLIAIALLQACGGGGGGNDSPSTPIAADTTPTNPTTPAAVAPPASADGGAVSASFVAGTAPRYQLTAAGSQSFGRLDPFVQAASGAMTTIASTVLSGASVTKDIRGDASFAIGRWVTGTVTRSSGADTLSGTDNRSYHYVVFNAVSHDLPTSGSLSCDAGAFTSPTYANGGSGVTVNVGTASGTAGLSFGATGAVVTGNVGIAVAGTTGSVAFNTTISSPASASITGAYLSGGAGAAVQLGDAGAGVYEVIASYGATLPSGARYIGAVRFRCA